MDTNDEHLGLKMTESEFTDICKDGLPETEFKHSDLLIRAYVHPPRISSECAIYAYYGKCSHKVSVTIDFDCMTTSTIVNPEDLKKFLTNHKAFILESSEKFNNMLDFNEVECRLKRNCIDVGRVLEYVYEHCNQFKMG